MRNENSWRMEINFNFSKEEKVELLKIAREAVVAAMTDQAYVPEKPESRKLLEKAGAFVTLRERGELRGCIGYIEARLSVYETVAETAAKAAVSDPRFEPVGEEELKDIEVEVSVLSSLTKVNDVKEIDVGKHGVLIENGFYRGLLLPQVATENGWGRDEFLRYTCMKAGLEKDCYKTSGTKIYIFTAEVFSEGELGIIPEAYIAKRT